MRCAKVRKLLALYLTGDLREQAKNSIKNHLSSCAECAGVVQSYRESREALASLSKELTEEKIFTGYWEGIYQRIREMPAGAGKRTLGLSFWFSPRVKFATVFALFFLAGIGGGLILWQQRLPTVRTVPVAERATEDFFILKDAAFPDVVLIIEESPGGSKRNYLLGVSRKTYLLPAIEPEDSTAEFELPEARLLTGEDSGDLF